ARSEATKQSRATSAALGCFASLAMTGAGVFCESQSLQPAEIAKFLHALALHFGGVDVAFAVDREIVQVVELAGAVAHVAEGGDVFSVSAVEQVEFCVGIIQYQQVGCRCVGP